MEHVLSHRSILQLVSSVLPVGLLVIRVKQWQSTALCGCEGVSGVGLGMSLRFAVPLVSRVANTTEILNTETT